MRWVKEPHQLIPNSNRATRKILDQKFSSRRILAILTFLSLLMRCILLINMYFEGTNKSDPRMFMHISISDILTYGRYNSHRVQMIACRQVVK